MRRAALLLAVALTAACGGTPSVGPSSALSPSPLPPSPFPRIPGIEAEVVLLRTDEAVGGQVQVRITDTGDAPFTVTSVALDSAGFEPLEATAVEAGFVPGRVIDLPIPYGEPVCAVAPLPAVASLTVVRPGGAVEDLTVPLVAEVLGRIHREECAALAVLEVVGVEVTGLREDGDALRGELTLTRLKGEEQVTASRLGRSVLIDATVDSLPLELAGEPLVSTTVTFTPATCDPHVLAETKKPYVFPLAVTVGDDETVSVDLPLDEAARSRLAALVQRVCTPAG